MGGRYKKGESPRLDRFAALICGDEMGLPYDYPMVCPKYSLQRSKMAKDMGLGRIANGGGE
jgi:hypothetical protein